MRGDFSRLSFDASRRFTRVLMQQGRVQLDSDWNERQEIDRYLERTALQGTVGAAGVPALSDGFAIGLAAAGNDLTIGPGQLFVDGLLCESIGATFATQPDLPLAASGLAGLVWPSVSGRYLAYLDVWEGDVGVLEDARLRETALGGPDTATRTRLIWQLLLIQVDDHAAAEAFPPGWRPDAAPGVVAGQMLAQTLPAGAAAGPCTLPPTARYTSLTNQLYRVEINQGGTLGTDAPTFVWSRDNASVVTAVTAVTGQTITVADLGPDDALGFAPGQVVELVDARTVLAQQRGTLLLVDGVDPVANTVHTTTAAPAPDFSAPVLLRRWDQAAGAALDVPLSAAATALEAGITVTFTTGVYRAGDYWTFAARTAIDALTGNILWPGPAGTPLLPEGIEHHYAPLALVQFSAPSAPATPPAGQFTLVEDCRALFAPGAGRLPGLRARWSNGGALADLVTGQSIPLGAFGQGIMVATAATLDPTSLSPASVRLVADVPVTMSQVLSGSVDMRVVGTQEVSLAADIALTSGNRAVVNPRQSAQDLLGAALSRRLGGASDADFAHQFSTVDTTPARANWAVQPGGTVLQSVAQAGMQFSPAGASLPGVPALALSLSALDAPVVHAGVSFAGGPTTGDAGIVFNWRSNADFWVFYNSFYFDVIGFSGAIAMMTFGLTHFVNGQVLGNAQTTGSFDMREDATGRALAWSADLDLSVSNTGLNYGAKITWADNAVQTAALAFTPQVIQAAIPASASAPAPAPPRPRTPGGGTPIDRTELPMLLQANQPTAFASRTLSTTLFRNSATFAAANTVVSPAVTAAIAAAAAAQPAAAATAAILDPLPTALLPGTRIGMMTRGKGDATFTRLQWTKASDQTVTAIPLGASAPVLVRLIVKRALLRTAAEAQALDARGIAAVPAAEPDFETAFLVTTDPAGYYGSGVAQPGGLPGIGTELL